ncbi:uncharacterized protein [Primulina huaijiensis]|uniref:uncharacterized protein isoform X2 n=1 Tax=Primulina huaijiensis TaxID=1492673 RepID=UPI003CC73B00
MDPVYHGAGYVNPEFSWNQNGYGRNEYPHPHLQDIHEAIQRGIEKERIREEIIVSEIVRRRVLEAEVRRELMMEREMALLQDRNGFPFGSSPVMGLESLVRPSLLVTRAEGWSAEKILGMELQDKEKLKRSEYGGLETLSFQRGTADLRISEIKPASEGNIEKERILLLPDESVSRSKTKDVTPPEVVNLELHADVIANKISKEEWSCALCKFMSSSEKDLNKHVLGKKHILKVAALRAQRTGKNYSIGLFPKKPTNSIHVEEKGVKLKAQSLFSQKGRKATSKKDDLPLSQNPKLGHLKKTRADQVIQKVQKNENDPRKEGCKFSEVMNAHKLGIIELPTDVMANKKSKEWTCALCQVIATSEKDLNEHVLGKKHKSKVAALSAQRTGENLSTGLFPKRPTKSIHVEEKGVKLKAQSLYSQKGGKATSKKDDLPLSQNPKSEHLKKTQAEVIQNVQKNENDPREKSSKFSKVVNAHKLWNIELPADVNANKKPKEWSCALCQVSATSKKDLNEHMHGKKHKLKEAALRSS